MSVQFRHKALTKSEYFPVGFSLRVEVRTAFAASHWECGEGVFEDLLESEKFNDRKVDRRMEALQNVHIAGGDYSWRRYRQVAHALKHRQMPIAG